MTSQLIATHHRNCLCSDCRRVLVDATGTRRRLQALARAGYTVDDVTIELGMPTSQRIRVKHWRSGRTLRVWIVTYRLVREVYEQWWDTEGTSRWCANWAERHGWQPYEAWTDTTIDDPAAQPFAALEAVQYIDEIKLERVRRGLVPFVSLTTAEQTVLLLEHVGRGLALRAFRDRYRPVPISTLRLITRQTGLELDL